MTEEKALTTQKGDLTIWQMIGGNRPIAQVYMESRLFRVQTLEQYMVIMFKGHELGMSLSAALEFIHIIEGKPSISPKGMMALIQKSGFLESLKITDEKDDQGKAFSCTVTMKRTNGTEYTTQYTMEDAKAAGLIKPNSAWEKYPANMLRWRAVGYCADIVFPDLCGGMYRPEELGANVEADGDVIEGTSEWIQAPATIPTVPQPIEPITKETNAEVPIVATVTNTEIPVTQSTPQAEKLAIPTFADLLKKWTPDRIVETFGGIPANDTQVLEAWEKLKAEDKLEEKENGE